jgi:hypothetical protein
MHPAITGEYVAVSHLKGQAVEAHHCAAGLFDHQPARGVIPRMKLLLPKSFESPHRCVTQIHRRRSRTPYGLTLRDKTLKVVKVIIGRFADVVGKSRCQQAFL